MAKAADDRFADLDGLDEGERIFGEKLVAETLGRAIGSLVAAAVGVMTLKWRA